MSSTEKCRFRDGIKPQKSIFGDDGKFRWRLLDQCRGLTFDTDRMILATPVMCRDWCGCGSGTDRAQTRFQLEVFMKLVTKIAMVAAVALAFAGCDDQAKKDLAKCQEDAGKVTAELEAAKGELEAAKTAAADLQTKLDEATKALEAANAELTQLKEAAAAAPVEEAKPAPAPAKKPAAKKAEPKQPEPVRQTTSTGSKAPPQRKR